jgi:hypothetical protein
LLFTIPILTVLLTLPAAAQGVGSATASGSSLGRAVAVWVVSAAAFAALYYFVVLPLLSQESGEPKGDPGAGLEAGARASAFAPLRWKNLQNEFVDYLIIGTNDGVIRVMNRKTGQVAFEFEVEELHSCPISCMAVCARTGQIAVPAGLSNDVIAFRMNDIVRLKPDGTPPGTPVRQDELGLVTALAFNAGGSLLAVGTTSGPITLYRMDATPDAPQSPQEFSGHTDAVQSLAFDPTNDAVFASGGKDRSLWLWGRQPGGERLTTETHSDRPVRSLAFRTDGKILASAVDGSVELRNMTGGPPEPYETLKHVHVNSVAWCGARLLSLSEAEGALWEPEPAAATAASVPGNTQARSTKLARKLLKHGGVYITATRNDTSVLTVGRDILKRVDNVVWELPVHNATMQPLPEEPEYELPNASIVFSEQQEVATDVAVVQEVPQKRVRRRRTVQGPMRPQHKLVLAAMLVLALIPAYLAQGWGGGAKPAEEATPQDNTSPGTTSVSTKVDFEALQTLVKNVTARMHTAAASPKKTAHDQWVKVRTTAEHIDNPNWTKKAQQENDALQQGKTSSREALDDLAQSRLILARAEHELGEDDKAVQVVKDLLSHYSQANVPVSGGSEQPINDALQAQLKTVYAKATGSSADAGR